MKSDTDDNRPHDTGRAHRRDRSDFDVNGDLEEYMHRTPSGYIYYVIPAGINVIFQDEDGNEITRFVPCNQASICFTPPAQHLPV
jgi:hypothetical protein